MLWKEQRKTFELRDGPVVVPKTEQMETKIVHLCIGRFALLCLGWCGRVPHREYPEQETDHLKLAS